MKFLHDRQGQLLTIAQCYTQTQNYELIHYILFLLVLNPDNRYKASQQIVLQ